jgi:hypothetical protein
MKTFLIVVGCLILFACTSLTKMDAQNASGYRTIAQSASPDPKNYSLVSETDNFKIYLKKDAVLTDDEKSVLTQTLESGLQKVSTFLGVTSNKKFTVLLEGEAMKPGQAPEYPSVEDDNTIMLYRFPGIGTAYLQGLPHELVHAMRFELRTLHHNLGDYLKGYGFVEEGLAEFVAREIEPKNLSFPNYGFPLDVVAGYWISTAQEIPIQVLFNHHEINPRCIAQAYPLRASFFKYLSEVYGNEKILQLANFKKEFSENIFLEVFKKSFGDLISEWHPWAVKRYESFPEGDKILQSYLSKTAIKYFPVCKAGKEF